MNDSPHSKTLNTHTHAHLNTGADHANRSVQPGVQQCFFYTTRTMPVCAHVGL